MSSSVLCFCPRSSSISFADLFLALWAVKMSGLIFAGFAATLCVGPAFDVDPDISDDNDDEKEAELEEEIALPLSCLAFFLP